MKRWALVLLAVLAAVDAWAEISLFYVRHAEGGHNVVKQFEESGIPTNEWPAYVGKGNMFTPLGQEQAGVLAEGLKDQRFDLIAVSPLWRTRNTILPYLRASGQQAEIWPELAEIPGYELTPELVAAPVAADLFVGRRSTVKLTEEESGIFKMGVDGWKGRELMVTNAAEAAALYQRVEKRLQDRFGTRPARVLLVGHGNASHTLLRYLTDQPTLRKPQLKNTFLWDGTLKDDGTFDLLHYNQEARDLFKP